MFQHTAQIPLTVDEITLIEELEIEVFVDLDCNGEPFVSEIQFEDQHTSRVIELTRKSEGAEQWLWNALKNEAWEAVRSDVADELLEAA